MPRGRRPPAPDQPASIAAVARRAGVSIATVSRVINGVANKASAETVARVRAAIEALDYRPSSAGRSLRRRQSRLVAVLAANMANPTMAAIAASAEIALRESGLVMVLCDTHDRPDLQDEYLREMRAHEAQAIVLLAAIESPLLAAFRAGRTPLVFVNRRDPGGARSAFVGIDNARAGRDVAEHALARGVRRAAILHAPIASSATRERVEAIAAAFAAAGRAIPGARVLAPPAEDHLALGYAAMRSLQERGERVDGLICAGDLIAFGAHRRLVESGGAALPPIYGFDDNPLNDWVAPWLSSVRIPYSSYGRAIVDLIRADPGEDDRVRILPHLLVERGRPGATP